MNNIKRIVPAILVIALLLSCATCALASGTIDFVTTGECHMRKSPSLNGKEVTTLKKGTFFKASDDETDDRGVIWYFGTGNGESGWVSEKNLKKSSDPGGWTENTTYVTTGECNMRKSSSKDSKKIATLEKGSTLKATQYREDDRGVTWHYGTSNGYTGWVSEANLKISTNPGSDEKSEKAYYLTTGDCNMRKSPKVDGKKIATLKEGSTLKATKYKKDSRGVKWHYGSCGDHTGWVSEANLEKIDVKPTPKPIDYSGFRTTGYYVTITASSLNMRKEPSTEYPILGSYENGTVLYSIRSNGSWAELLDESEGRTGYMSENYLERYEPYVTAAPTFDDLFASELASEKAEPVEMSFEATADVMPNPVVVDLELPENGTYPVSFLPENLVKINGILYLTNLHLFTKDTYDIVDIAQLQTGNTILIEGQPVLVNTIERGDSVEINGGVDNGGWTLCAIEEGNGFVVRGLNDAATYTDHGIVNLPLSADSFIYTDDSDPQNQITANFATILETFRVPSDFGYTPYNTTVCIEMGVVTEIARSYQP